MFINNVTTIITAVRLFHFFLFVFSILCFHVNESL